MTKDGLYNAGSPTAYETDKLITALKSDTSGFDDNNASVNSEYEHESGTSETEPVQQLLLIKIRKLGR